MTSKLDISIVICCYNSEQLLAPTLKHLNEQNVLEDFSFEIVLVDNNSSDGTALRAKELWTAFNSRFSLRIVQEPTPGLSFARKTGVINCTAEIILFCDDDNWLHPDYLTLAVKFMNQNLQIGVLGGQSKAAFESQEPIWWAQHAAHYAVGKQAKESGDISSRGFVWGAGMVMRKSLLLRLYNAGFNSLLHGRKGKALSAGDDSEFCKWILLMGYKLWYLESLNFVHYITSARLKDSYFDAMQEGHKKAYEILSYYDWYLYWYENQRQHQFSEFSLNRMVKYLWAGLRRRDAQWLLIVQFELQTTLKLQSVLFRIIKTHQRLLKQL